MSKILIVIATCAFFLSMNAQQLETGEYFIDTDPGAGSATSFTFTQSDSVSLPLNIPTGTLTVGFHKIYVRVKNSSNVWSHSGEHLFYVFSATPPASPVAAAQLTIGEYYFDTDPGVGNATTFTFTPADSVNKSLNAPTGTLTEGFHKLYTRVKDSNNIWGVSSEHLFYVYNTAPPVSQPVSTPVAALEYFFDEVDFGPGQCTSLPPFTPLDSVHVLAAIPVNTLTVGVHHINIRAKDVFGKWSITKSIIFNVCSSPTITASSGSICSGDSFLISPDGANSYTVSGDNFTVSPGATTSYSITGTSSSGCPATNTAVITVTVHDRPVIAATGGSICAGSNFTIFPSGATTYTYSGGNHVVNPGATTSYSITGTSTAGCLSSNTAVATVSVFARPVVSANSGSICAGKTFTIVPSGASTYSVTGNNFTVSPSANASYSVTGTSSAGCLSSNTAVASVTVHAMPVVSVNSGSVCSGKNFTITPTGASSYTFSPISGPGTATNQLVFSPATLTQYHVAGTSSVGCVSFTTALSTVSVQSSPTIAASGGSICSGSSFTITPGGASTYSITGNTFTVSPSATANYSVTGTATNGCVSNLAAVVTITVHARPSVAVNSGSICAGGSFSITPSGANTYTVTGNNFLVSPASNTSYSVTGTSLQGCLSTNTAVSTITVNALPVVSAVGGSICAGEVFTLSPSGASSYTFSSGSATVSPNANTSYSITGSSAAGCISSNTAVANVTVYALPVVSVNSGSICAGQSFTLMPTGAISYTFLNGSATVSPAANTSYSVIGSSAEGCTSPNPAIATITVHSLPVITVNSGSICAGSVFTIVPNGGASYTISGGSYTVSPATSTLYTIQAESAQGCRAALQDTSFVTVHQLPVLALNSGSICAGQIYTLTPSGAATYTLSSANNTVSPANTTTYQVTGTSAEGCPASNTAVAAVTVHALPSVSITASNDAACEGDEVTLSASGALTYSWSNNQTSVIVTTIATSGAQYTVSGTDVNGCVNDQVYSITTSECTGIMELMNVVRIYPNPSTGIFVVELGHPATVSLLNGLGQLIFNTQFDAGRHELRIDDSKGVYLLMLNVGKKIERYRLIKQ